MKVIRSAKTREEAECVIAYAKSLPGFHSVNKYRAAGKFHILVDADMSGEEYERLMGNHRNLANRHVKR